MAEEFRLPIFDFRLNPPRQTAADILNQKLAQENDSITISDRKL
jgi:hypothetical protein